MTTIHERCIGCQACLARCPEAALRLDGQTISRDHERCSLCLDCVEICPVMAHEALVRG
ncbi:4Fe-4S binding protein [Desulfofustis limnaeus]|uniref:4Fe-4S binding protein n=1 Tax=Desulfofustis limnaeus TaxID=2740163 RepID=UPI0024DFE72A|nr:4Fe-4S binding protein [Desulfofustis limnaeus]